jgi:hypothetical protein
MHQQQQSSVPRQCVIAQSIFSGSRGSLVELAGLVQKSGVCDIVGAQSLYSYLLRSTPRRDIPVEIDDREY